MRTGIAIDLNSADRARLEAIAADRNSRQKHVWRSRMVLLRADGNGTIAIMREAGVANSIVDLQSAINRYVAEHNDACKPFTWTKALDEIIAAVRRGHQFLGSIR